MIDGGGRWLLTYRLSECVSDCESELLLKRKEKRRGRGTLVADAADKRVCQRYQREKFKVSGVSVLELF